MAEISQSSNNNESSNVENESNLQRTEPETDLLDYSEAMTGDTPSALQQPSGFEGLGSSLPSVTGNAMRPQVAKTSRSELGISPALINSRATSLALETASNRSTPVHRPVDRQVFPVNSTTATGWQILSPTPLLPNRNQFAALSPSPAPLGLDDIIVDNQELETVIHLFNKQWNTFVQARENQNLRLMRMALVQAISSQDEIRLLAGGAEMLRICENWIAREELADLERAEAASCHQTAQRSAAIKPATSTPATVYSTPIGGCTTNAALPSAAPPPPSTERLPQPTTSAREVGAESRAPSAPGYASRPESRSTTAPPPPTSRKLERIREEQETPPIIEVGEYLMRAKRIAGRVFRDQARGRGRGRRGPPRQEEPPAEPRQ
ncbi:hypothetical protein PGTUg99_000736 [Puccinia graminis f. sp. tritici]|uniref:Uncharacterized protein n=1 Tax=Puccinia graminis f. sp. tritici TaxID=56615 RepID=A0A5B0LFZ3_PUCGR|nr:hypothetical protein PGTUg99_003021 [Puccinia graminis f. sp. tritici]KAA1090355.1 hypothetical protein PGTUg99_000736 [Puccinia graminis f. sp. tritici]